MNSKNLESVRKAIAFDLIYDFEDKKKDYDQQDEIFEGHRIGKKFFRVDTNCFKPLLDELLNNPNCGYYTYANEVIKEGFILERLSCLLKQLKKSYINNNSPHEQLAVSEVLCSQILNFYGCPTPYNAPIYESKEQEDEYKILSVDFSTEYKELKSLSEFNCSIWSTIEDCLDRVKITLQFLNVDNETKQKFMEDFMTSHIVRKFILTDDDFTGQNSGIIKDKYINFDFELGFKELDQLERAVFNSNLRVNLQYLDKNYPTIYKNIMKKTQILVDGLHKLVDSGQFVFANDMHEKIVKQILANNLHHANKIFKEIEMKKSIM